MLRRHFTNQKLTNNVKLKVSFSTPYHGLVAVAGMELHVDLAVDASFALGMIVLTALTDSHFVEEILTTRCFDEEK